MKWLLLVPAAAACVAWCFGGWILVVLVPVGIAEACGWVWRRAVRCWSGPGRRVRPRRA